MTLYLLSSSYALISLLPIAAASGSHAGFTASNRSLQQLDAVEGYQCEGTTAPYGYFDIENCQQARQDLHDDPSWPDKRKTWTSISYQAFRTFGTVRRGCVVVIGAKDMGLVGAFTLADVEAGLLITAGKCSSRGRNKGGWEYYTTVNETTGEEIADFSNGWAMRFYNPRRFGRLNETDQPFMRNITLAELEE